MYTYLKNVQLFNLLSIIKSSRGTYQRKQERQLQTDRHTQRKEGCQLPTLNVNNRRTLEAFSAHYTHSEAFPGFLQPLRLTHLYHLGLDSVLRLALAAIDLHQTQSLKLNWQQEQKG